MSKGGASQGRQWSRLALAAAMCAVLAVGLVGIAVAQTVSPPLPSDAELDRFAQDSLVKWRANVTFSGCPTCGAPVLSAPKVTKMHWATAEIALARMNVVVIDFTHTIGPLIDGSYEVRYHLLFARIPEPPLGRHNEAGGVEPTADRPLACG